MEAVLVMKYIVLPYPNVRTLHHIYVRTMLALQTPLSALSQFHAVILTLYVMI